MTPQQIIGTGVRLFAIWLLLSSIAYFTAIPNALAGQDLLGGNTKAAVYIIGSLYVTVAALLWFFPMTVAHKLLPRTSHTNTLRVHGFDLARAGIGLLGLWLLAKSLPTIVWLLFSALLFMDTRSTFGSLPPETKLQIAVSAFEVFLAFVFVFQSRALAGAVMSNPISGSDGAEP
jgi:hypothetical protein